PPAGGPPRLRAPRPRHYFGPLVRVSLLRAPRRRAHFLAAGIDSDVGFPAGAPRQNHEPRRPRSLPVRGRLSAVGHSGARPARIFRGLPRRDLVAQSRAPDDESAAPRRARRLADGG